MARSRTRGRPGSWRRPGPARSRNSAACWPPSGSARLWVPATQSRAAAFAPGADVRGLRDLPVLIVAGRDLAGAAAAVTADLADSVIEVTRLAGGAGPGQAGSGQAGSGPGQAAAGEAGPGGVLAPRSVALLNRGTPGSLVSPDGTLHIALMRSCSAWPSGVWIDGDQRTAPDGSSFAWQHWSHTFEYALTAGPGDWRDAGFAVAGQDYNHDLLACETGLHPGPHPAAASLASADLPVMVSALKPRGNPLAAGRPGLPRRADGVTVRVRDLGSRSPGVARLSLFTGITAAQHLSLVEGSTGAGSTGGEGGRRGGRADGGSAGAAGSMLPVRDGQAEVAIAPGRDRRRWGWRSRPRWPGRRTDPAPRRTPRRRRSRNRRSPSTPATGCTARDRPRPGTCRWRCT